METNTRGQIAGRKKTVEVITVKVVMSMSNDGNSGITKSFVEVWGVNASSQLTSRH
jgi:hypothetical protein